jgi:TolB protein
MPAEGGAARRLTNTGSAGGPKWSPDGQSIVFGSLRRIGDNSVGSLYTVDLAGGEPRLLSGSNWATAAVISPDGSRIAYMQNQTGANGFDIWVMDADGSNAHALTTGPGSAHSPVWSPDGSQILFRTERGGGVELAVVPAIGGDVRLLTDTPLTEEGSARWSPDGKRIIYTAGETKDHIVRVNVEPLLKARPKP